VRLRDEERREEEGENNNQARLGLRRESDQQVACFRCTGLLRTGAVALKKILILVLTLLAIVSVTNATQLASPSCQKH